MRTPAVMQRAQVAARPYPKQCIARRLPQRQRSDFSEYCHSVPEESHREQGLRCTQSTAGTGLCGQEFHTPHSKREASAVAENAWFSDLGPAKTWLHGAARLPIRRSSTSHSSHDAKQTNQPKNTIAAPVQIARRFRIQSPSLRQNQ